MKPLFCRERGDVPSATVPVGSGVVAPAPCGGPENIPGSRSGPAGSAPSSFPCWGALRTGLGWTGRGAIGAGHPSIHPSYHPTHPSIHPIYLSIRPAVRPVGAGTAPCLAGHREAAHGSGWGPDLCPVPCRERRGSAAARGCVRGSRLQPRIAAPPSPASPRSGQGRVGVRPVSECPSGSVRARSSSSRDPAAPRPWAAGWAPACAAFSKPRVLFSKGSAVRKAEGAVQGLCRVSNPPLAALC